jgi:DNA-binding MltR family transcriptional regulator
VRLAPVSGKPLADLSMAKKPKVPPKGEALQSAVPTLTKADPRATALMSAAWLDDALFSVLKAYLSRDSKLADQMLAFDAPLGSFGARIKFAYLLGLISSEVRQDLDTIRTIRNDFAHVREPMSFKDHSVKDRCRNFNTIRVFDSETPARTTSARQQYLLTAYLLSHALISMAEHMKAPEPLLDGPLLWVRRVARGFGMDQILDAADRVG